MAWANAIAGGLERQQADGKPEHSLDVIGVAERVGDGRDVA